MFLYDKKDNSIDVYSLIGIKQALKEYRQDKMQAIPEREQVVVAESYSYDMDEVPVFELYANQFDSTIIPSEYANSQDNSVKYHILKTGKTSRRNREILLERYYLGQLWDRSVARVQYADKIRYYLLNSTTYTNQNYSHRIKRLKDIIELPESLYLLQMLEQENYPLLWGNDITEQLDLFSFEYVDELRLSEIKKMATCGLTKDSYEQIMIKARNNEPILSLLKANKK